MSDAQKISRRAVAKGIAWSVPAVAVTAAVPAYAFSGGGPTVEITGSACKWPGQSCKPYEFGYTIPVTISNPTNFDIYVYDVTFTATGTSLTFQYAPPPYLPIFIPATESVNVFLTAKGSNSANQAFTLNMLVYWSHESNPANDPQQGQHTPIPKQISISATPPDCTKVQGLTCPPAP